MKKFGLLFLIVCAIEIAACSLPENEGVSGLMIPDRTTFPKVADALQPSCGTLDCHGQPGRNLRLYGGRGLRLDPMGNPADEATTEAEYRASFASLVGLEPEALDVVVRQSGLDSEQLSLIRKARGVELHRGGVQMLPGDPLDRCLTSWLSGRVHEDACLRVSSAPRPHIEVP